jgi:hypothetical protein
LNKVWDMLKVSAKDRSKFLDGPIKDILYTEMGIIELDRKIEALQLEWQEKADIIKRIQDRQDLIQVSSHQPAF